MNKLDREARAKILSLLCEGVSIRAITRLTGASKNTVSRLLVDVGRACAEYQDNVLRNLPCKRVQLDEIWAFVYAKNDNVKDAKAAPANQRSPPAVVAPNALLSVCFGLVRPPGLESFPTPEIQI